MPRRSKAALVPLELKREVTDLPRIESAVIYMRGTTHASQLPWGAREYSTRDVLALDDYISVVNVRESIDELTPFDLSIVILALDAKFINC